MPDIFPAFGKQGWNGINLLRLLTVTLFAAKAVLSLTKIWLQTVWTSKELLLPEWAH